MSKITIKNVLAAAVIVACTVTFTGCKKEEYTIDTPYDFSQIASGKQDDSEQKGDESAPTAVPGEEKENNAENQSDGNNSQSEGGREDSAATGGSAQKPSGEKADGNSSEDKTTSSDNSSDSGTQGNPAGTTGGNASGNADTDPETKGPSFIEIAEDYQIPKDIEYKMTTKALLDTYMSYPFLDIICFEESPEDTYNQWINSDLSCGKELMGRKDVVSVALTYYKELIAMEPTTRIESDYEIDSELKIDWIELLFNQDTVKNKATDKEKAEILKQARLRDSNVEKNGYAITDRLPDLAAAYK